MSVFDYRDFWPHDEKRERDLEQEEYEREQRIERLYDKGGLPHRLPPRSPSRPIPKGMSIRGIAEVEQPKE